MIAVAVALLCVAAPGRADEEHRQRSINHWETGKGFFELKRYEDAMREFVAGYALEARPAFLYNIGLCHARLGHLEDARDFFRRFLEQAPAGHPLRENALVEQAEVERRLAARPPATPDAGAPANAVPVSPTAPQREASPPAPARRRSVLWWLLPVAAVVLAGVAVGIYFGTRPACDADHLACFDLR
jgi:hypothetical protein